MKKDQAIEFLKLLDAKVPNSQPRSDWAVSDCPLGHWRHEGGFSSAEVFGVKVEAGDSFCNCFSCGWAKPASETVMEIKRLEGLNPSDKKRQLGKALQLIAQAEENMEFDFDTPDIEEMLFGGGKKKDLVEYPEWWLDSFNPALDFPLAKDYLHGRDVPDSVTQALDLRFDTMEKRICFPVRDFKHTLRGLHGRALEKSVDPRYRMYQFAKTNNPIIWLGETWVDLNKPIVVVEGPFDIASVYRVYRNVVSPLFSNPNLDKVKRMSDAIEWISLYDRGKGGDTGRAKLDKALGKTHVLKHLHPPEGRKDPGEMSVSDIQELLEDHVQLDEILS